jgi:hypothetical protein
MIDILSFLNETGKKVYVMLKMFKGKKQLIFL